MFPLWPGKTLIVLNKLGKSELRTVVIYEDKKRRNNLSPNKRKFTHPLKVITAARLSTELPEWVNHKKWDYTHKKKQLWKLHLLQSYYLKSKEF